MVVAYLFFEETTKLFQRGCAILHSHWQRRSNHSFDLFFVNFSVKLMKLSEIHYILNVYPVKNVLFREALRLMTLQCKLRHLRNGKIMLACLTLFSQKLWTPKNNGGNNVYKILGRRNMGPTDIQPIFQSGILRDQGALKAEDQLLENKAKPKKERKKHYNKVQPFHKWIKMENGIGIL